MNDTSTELPEPVDILAIPHIAALSDTADTARKEANLAGKDHAHQRNALAHAILATQWPNVGAVEVDMAMHLAQVGNLSITRLFDAESNVIHVVEDSEDVLDLAEGELTVALAFANESAVGWQEQRDPAVEEPRHRLTFTPEPAPEKDGA